MKKCPPEYPGTVRIVRCVSIGLLLLLFAGCKKEYSLEGTSVPVTPPQNGPLPPSTTVYVAGRQSSPGGDVVTLWENGAPVALTDGTKQGDATAVFLYDEDVYVAGYEYNGQKRVAKLWKNKVAVDLTDGTNDAAANAVVVAGADVYVAGFETHNNKTIAMLWKNGVATALTDGAHNAYITAVFLADGNVYCSGTEHNGSKYIAKYWKNGVPVSISTGQYNTYANDIAVKNGMVYIALTEVPQDITKRNKALLWKNGTLTSLTDGITENAVANRILLNGNDVYVTGTEGNYGKYWKNGSGINLGDGQFANVGIGLFLHNGDMYVAGRAYNGNKNTAVLWTNGVPALLSDINSDADAHDVAAITR